MHSRKEKHYSTHLPRPYFTSFFRCIVVSSLSGDGKALSFFFNESIRNNEYVMFIYECYNAFHCDFSIPL